MYKVVTKRGDVYTCSKYEFNGDNIVLDDSSIIAGKPQDFTITDLDAPDGTEWFIDVGPFFDRFGAAKMAVLTSTNSTVKAIVQDVLVRKWVDLQRPDVAAGIDALIALGVPGVTAELKEDILTTPITEEESLALQKLYFNK